MTTLRTRHVLALACLVAGASQPALRAAGESPLTLVSARVALEGTSNIHAFTASTSTVRLTASAVADGPGDPLDRLLQPGGLTALAVTIPVATLTSPKEGIDKNMHKALKATEHADITFRLRRLEQSGDAYRVIGSLTIAGVEREVVLAAQATRKTSTVAVTATTDLLMTDFGIAPPKAMLGMLKTNPAVKVKLDVELGVAAAQP